MPIRPGARSQQTHSRRAILAGSAALVASSLAGPARAAYPERAIKLIVPFPPGGLFDTVGRPLADRLKGGLGTIVIENIAGAGSSRGAGMAARAEADGYTLILGGNGSHVLMPLASTKLTYDPVRDFEPAAFICTSSLGIAVHPSQPYQTLSELVEAARKDSAKLTFGSAGTGTLAHLTGEMFKSIIGAPGIVHVPYSGGGPLSNDLLGGHIPLAMVNLTNQFFELHAAKKLRILAVTTPARLAVAPEIPAAVETVPGMISQNFAGLFAPKGTKPEIIKQIETATAEALKDDELRKIYAGGGFVVGTDNSAEAMRKFLADEIVRWGRVVQASGFKLN